jgi:hypothetical protein
MAHRLQLELAVELAIPRRCDYNAFPAVIVHAVSPIRLNRRLTWFPLVDRNPQRFVPNIFEAKPSDFQKATMRVFHSADKPTRIGPLSINARRPQLISHALPTKLPRRGP